MKKLLIISFLLSVKLVAQPIYNPSVRPSGERYLSKETLASYLSRAMTFSGLGTEIHDDIYLKSNGVYYNYSEYKALNPKPTSVADQQILQMRNEDIALINRLGVKYVKRFCGFWYEWNIGSRIGRAEETAQILKAQDPQIILEGAVFEIVSRNLIQNEPEVHRWIPSYVFEDFGQNYVGRSFNFDNMMYDFYSPTSLTSFSNINCIGNNETIKLNYEDNIALASPDMSKLETQMWYYYWATRYIDLGCEALHLGILERVSYVDKHNGYAGWKNLTQKIREYAKAKNRGFVILNCHFDAHYDPIPSTELPEGEELLFDFEAYPIRINSICNLRNTYSGDTDIPAPPHMCPRYGHGLAGNHPQGWYTDKNFLLVEFDNFGVVPAELNQFSTYLPWGWDEITWYGLNPENYRNEWLRYAWYKVKRLDDRTFLEIPGRRGMSTCYLNQVWEFTDYNICRDPIYRVINQNNSNVNEIEILITFSELGNPTNSTDKTIPIINGNQEAIIKELYANNPVPPIPSLPNYEITNTTEQESQKGNITVTDFDINYYPTIAKWQASESVTSINATVDRPVEFIAGDKIVLKPGFKTVNSSYFNVKTDHSIKYYNYPPRTTTNCTTNTYAFRTQQSGTSTFNAYNPRRINHIIDSSQYNMVYNTMRKNINNSDKIHNNKPHNLALKNTIAIKPYLYPNPATNYIQVFTHQPNSLIRIVNTNGIVLLQYPNIDNYTEIDISELKNGVYQVQIINEQETYTLKLVK